MSKDSTQWRMHPAPLENPMSDRVLQKICSDSTTHISAITRPPARYQTAGPVVFNVHVYHGAYSSSLETPLATLSFVSRLRQAPGGGPHSFLDASDSSDVRRVSSELASVHRYGIEIKPQPEPNDLLLRFEYHRGGEEPVSVEPMTLVETRLIREDAEVDQAMKIVARAVVEGEEVGVEVLVLQVKSGRTYLENFELLKGMVNW